MDELDLTFPDLSFGTHQIPWDLQILLYQGAASLPRKEAMDMIHEIELDPPEKDRLLLVCAFHEAIDTLIKKGRSKALIISNLEVLHRFYAWADDKREVLIRENVVDIFKAWSEYQIFRSQVKKDVSEMHAYRQVTKIANLLAAALKIPGSRPGAHLLLQTRMRKPNSRKRVLSTQADKQNLRKTFEFGNALKIICDKLDVTTVRGPLPILIEVDSDKTILLAGNLLDPYMDVNSIKDNTVRRNAVRARAPMSDDESLFDKHKRSGIVNLRIESELLIFIAQTGMNSAQAANIQREDYRWKSNGDDLDVFRVYKGRRSGEAVFRCFKSYKEHLQRYLQWLDDTGLSEFDGRLFPLQNRGIIPAKDSKIRFYTARGAFKRAGIEFFGPQDLRKTRVNWLLRRSNDLNLTAEQMAHDKAVLLRDYERPHHQKASIEILNFHKAVDPSFIPPGPGLCTDNGHKPLPIDGISEKAPRPDCISPEGCLFCSKHRDIMNADYCWKLASHARIKSLETNLYKPSENKETHPAYYVIERINQKLDAIASGNEVRAIWVKDAKDAVRSGRYHPNWIGHIQLLEVIA